MYYFLAIVGFNNFYCIDSSSLLGYILTSTALALYDLCLLDYKMPDNDIHFDKHWPSYILYTRNSQNDKKFGMRMHKISKRK